MKKLMAVSLLLSAVFSITVTAQTNYNQNGTPNGNAGIYSTTGTTGSTSTGSRANRGATGTSHQGAKGSTNTKRATGNNRGNSNMGRDTTYRH